MAVIPHIVYRTEGQPITRRKPAEAYAAVEEFLRRCTDWSGVWEPGDLTVFSDGPYAPPTWTGRELAATITTRLGEGRRSRAIVSASSGAEQDKLEWTVPPSFHQWAVETILNIPPLPSDSIEPASYSSWATYRLRDPRTGNVLAGQDTGETEVGRVVSGLFLYMSPTRIHGVFELVFPFAKPDDAFLDYLGAIRPLLPVRLARSSFRLRESTKRAGGFRDRRIAAGLFDGI